MYFIIKYLHIIIVGVVVIAIGYSLVRNRIRKNVEKEILNNPCYTEATIVDITPGTPSNIGIISIHVGYRFTTETGDTIEKDDELINIKTMDLQKYQVGSGIPIVYARNEPSKNMLNMRDAMKDFKRK
ncbi:hypothetical protein D781_4521 [Serratia sp. FGI94]|uniref:DUF3592 domain-containing protein n=1 Tax=Serratia sp. FGI94 TaxID=671990 RepID=UPI0002A6FE47|nr:DUF3592 domain-containing protein [Serratia sp. FGI94]AGB84683.1 hypothetical protein D781_4521 [Serratia sp. FGI94]